jgi:hypothetical protein
MDGNNIDVAEDIKIAAQDAASRGDPTALIKILSQSFALDGLTRRMQARWPQIDPEDISDIISFSVDTLYYRVREGKLITNVLGFLWKTTDNKVHERYRELKRTIKLEDLEGTLNDPSSDRDFAENVIDDLDKKEKRRIEGIKIAKSLLPRIKSQNIRDVLSYVIDVVEEGGEEVDHQKIADDLGISLRTVRDCLYRGFGRLSSLAIAEKIINEPFDFLQNDDPVDKLGQED